MTESAYYGRMGFARFYALVFGIAYIGVAIVELIVGSENPLQIGGATILQRTVLHNVVHAAVGIVVLGSFFAGELAARNVARVIGAVFLVLTIWGFVSPESLGGFLGYDRLTSGGAIPMSYNFVHAITAGLALFAGFSGARQPATAT